MAEAQDIAEKQDQSADDQNVDKTVGNEDGIASLKTLLVKHPDIFLQEPALLEDLQLDHATGGAVSLIERQVKQLRDGNRQLREQLQLLLATARENEQRVDQMNKLACQLLEAGGLPAQLETLGATLAEEFAIDHWQIFHDALPGMDDQPNVQILPDGGDVRTALEDSVRTGQVQCSAMDSELAESLFATGQAGSVAIVPLRRLAQTTLLVLGSKDEAKFRPDSGALLLGMLGDLVAAGLRRFCTNA